MEKRPRYSEQLDLNYFEPKGILKNKGECSPIKEYRRKVTNNVLGHKGSSSISPSKYRRKNKAKDIEAFYSKGETEDEPDYYKNKPCHYIAPPNQSFKEYSFQQEKNEKYRDYMEDFAKINEHFTDDPYKSLFGLFDGHGGFEIAKYASEHFSEIFKESLKHNNTKVERALKKSFLQLDEELRKFKKTDNIGSTATILFINKEADAMLGAKKVLYCANIGDTSCALFTNTSCKRLTEEHRCTNDSEIVRIKKAGGHIIQGRLDGKLAISRGFGDFSMKDKGLICEPSITKVELSDNDKLIVLCTDGVWDVLNEDDLFTLTLTTSQTEQIARDIIQQALERGSTDNMSCIVIKL